MMEPTAQDSTPAEADDAFTWRVHPAAERPFATLTAIIVILAIGLAVQVSAGGRWWALFATALMCLSLHRFFFATYFRIDAQGVNARTLFGQRTLSWDEVRRIVHGDHSAWISPYAHRSVRESQRGVLILFGRRRDEVLAQLRRRAGQESVKAVGDGPARHRR